MKFSKLLLPMLLLSTTIASTAPGYAQANTAAKGAGKEVVYVSVEERSDVRVIITDAQGKEIATVHDGILDAGDHTIAFDGATLPAGEWFYKVSTKPVSQHEQASVSVHIDERSRVTVTLVDANGRYIATAYDGVLNAGDHTVKFDASKMPAGEWFHRLNTEKTSAPVSLRN